MWDGLVLLEGCVVSAEEVAHKVKQDLQTRGTT